MQNDILKNTHFRNLKKCNLKKKQNIFLMLRNSEI